MGSFRKANLLLSLLLGFSFLSGACGSDDGGNPPQMTPLSDKAAFVGQEFTLEIGATDKDGDTLKFGFKSCRVTGDGCTDQDIGGRADLRQAGDLAVFRWTPIASDVGTHSFDFTVSDGKNVAKENITIEVKIQAGSSTAPIFRKPLGTGTTLDLTQKKCVDVEVVVEDSDSPGVEIRQAEPLIAEATFKQDDGLKGKWSWCPSPEQTSEGDRYALRLEADDGDNPPTTKNFLIVLRKAQKQDCPGEAPVIEHTPDSTISTVVGLTIDARVTDDQGIKYEPLLYYTFDVPSDPPDLAEMTQVTMEAISGTMQDGIWAADVPNPVASMPVGSVGSVYYVIVAQDNDDKEGDCDNLTQSPATGTHAVEVTNPGGAGGLGLCKACSTDIQCGGSNDLCAIMGAAGKTYCFRACSGDQDCPESDYSCSSPITSVGGVSARQCIPNSGQCGGSTTTCTDDNWEPNDTMTQAFALEGFKEGTETGLVMCPGPEGADEDWYPIDVDESGSILGYLEGGSASDLDLALVSASGVVLSKSEDLTSTEIVEACVPPGVYFLRVYSWQNIQNSYSLTYEFTPEVCAECADDSYEPDDDATEARNAYMTEATPYKSDTNAICPGNEDWFGVYMLDGETLYASIAFDQTNSQEDLDIILYKEATNLTPCDETTDTGCDQQNGQSWTSNERLVWPNTTEGMYYVVVRGFDGASNLYDICIGLQSSYCPPL